MVTRKMAGRWKEASTSPGTGRLAKQEVGGVYRSNSSRNGVKQTSPLMPASNKTLFSLKAAFLCWLGYSVKGVALCADFLDTLFSGNVVCPGGFAFLGGVQVFISP